MMERTIASPLARWRRVRGQLDAGQPPDPADAMWLAERCRAAIEGDQPLRVAFGLPRSGGAGRLGRVVALERRNALLRAIAGMVCAGMEPQQAAQAIAMLANRVQRHGARSDREADQLMFEALACGPIPQKRRIAAILRDFHTHL